VGHTSSAIVTTTAPATQSDFKKAEGSIASDLTKPFSPTEPDEALRMTMAQRRVRSELFQRDVRTAYKRLCALCGGSLVTPSEQYEVEAAHIIPRKENGSNDPRNGLALCRSHHWGFDRHLWTLRPDFHVLIPNQVALVTLNSPLLAHRGSKLRLPKDNRLEPAALALEYHRSKTLTEWGA